MELTADETISFIQPQFFTRGRNMYSQVKDNQINLDFLTKDLKQNKN